jgi:uncharacterized protein
MPTITAADITHNTAEQRFEITVDGHLCVADYRLQDGEMWMTHTAVSPALRGSGIAGALVQAALNWAAGKGIKVRPMCSYVTHYFAQHPEVAHLQAS